MTDSKIICFLKDHNLKVRHNRKSHFHGNWKINNLVEYGMVYLGKFAMRYNKLKWNSLNILLRDAYIFYSLYLGDNATY